MTFRDLLVTMLRRWYVPAAALVCAAALTFVFANDGGSYTTKTVISFIFPAKTALSPYNGAGDKNVIAFAGAVAHEINGGKPTMRYATEDAPFYGVGVREGVFVGLPNSGGQWSTSFAKAEIEIQIVGRSRDWVVATQSRLVDEVLRIADAQQAEAAASRNARIIVSVVPLTSRIDHITPTRTMQYAAGAAMFAAALIVGAWGAVMVDRILATVLAKRARADVRDSSGRVLEDSIA